MLTLALEPECAALAFCKYQSNDDFANYSGHLDDPHGRSRAYLVLDIGGGTVDITTLRYIPPDKYEIAIPPQGNASGGLLVNKEFSLFLERIVDDDKFENFEYQKRFWSKKIRRDHRATLTLAKIINSEFEKQKVKFGEKVSYDKPIPDQLLRVELGRSFVENYSQKKIQKRIEKMNDSRVKLNDYCTLEIKYSKMAEFFEPALEGIRKCVQEALRITPIDEIDAVCIAGGFGGCKYVFHFLKDIITQEVSKKLVFLVPKDYTLAVSRGAVHYCQEPDIITARMMDATYGIATNVQFVEGRHKETYANIADGEKFCGKVFKTFVTQGERVMLNDIKSANMIPLESTQTTAKFNFYRSTNPSVYYVTDKDTKLIGEIKLEIKNPANLPTSERTLRVTINFGLTEITAQAQALYLPGQPKVETSLDFLSKYMYT